MPDFLVGMRKQMRNLRFQRPRVDDLAQRSVGGERQQVARMSNARARRVRS